ncbi:MAG: penicillin acylase family protein [Pseudomonadales bacterium]
MSRLSTVVFLSLVFVAACSDNDSDDGLLTDSNANPAAAMLSATLKRTTNGIPHIEADDWASLGYGYGYAYAQDNFCTLMKEVVISNGQSQRYFGEEGDLADDFVFALLGDEEEIQRDWIDSLEQNVERVLRGYVQGFNQYLAETGNDNLAEGEEGCRGAEWVRPISVLDMGRVIRKLIVRASTDPLADFIFAAQAPVTMASAKRGQQTKGEGRAKKIQIDEAELQQAIAAINLPRPEQLGSNAYALGSDATQNGSGMLLGNPHFPWQEASRFYMVHLTMGDEYDVFGAALHGSPLINIGFNKDLAWSHTVSTGSRFVLYELKLDPDDPMKYEFDGEMHDITSKTVTIDVQTDNGVEQQEHTFYFSQFGPIIDLESVNIVVGGWPNQLGTVFALKDINLNNTRGLSQWELMGKSTSIAELQDALKPIGIPWVNTIAADRNGTAFYGDISAVPHLTEAQRVSCIIGVAAPLLTDFGLTTLDGSNPDCELGSDADTAPEVFGFDSLPKIVTTEYAANSNDSYWLSKTDELLTGFPQIIGDEGVEQSIRTRLAFVQIEERLAGTDDLGAPGFTVQNLQEVLFGSRNHAAELTNAELVTLCSSETDWSTFSSMPSAVADACTILSNWDTRHNVDSIGGHIFYEFWRIARDIESLWATPFDPADPVRTPRDLNVGDPTVSAALKQALADGVQVLTDNNITLNIPWGEVHFDERDGERIPIHGGSGSMLFSVITSDLVPDEGYSAIRHGNSYMQTVTWDGSECPDAFALLSYSQSTDPASPYYADQTRRYAQKDWLDAPFCAADIDATQVGDTLNLNAEELP